MGTVIVGLIAMVIAVPCALGELPMALLCICLAYLFKGLHTYRVFEVGV